MFQLEVFIENWRSKLVSSNAFTKSDIDELESHLLDEIDNLQKKDLTEEEAFYVACSRIGSAELLSNEFNKVNFNILWLKKILWLLSGYILISFFQQLVSTFSILTTSAIFKFTEVSSNQIMSLSLATNIIFSTIILCVLFLPKYMFISYIQAKFNFLFTCKRWLLILVLIIFTIINCIGFRFINIPLVRQIEPFQYGNIMIGQNISMLVWSITLCLIFIVLSLKNFDAK